MARIAENSTGPIYVYQPRTASQVQQQEDRESQLGRRRQYSGEHPMQRNASDKSRNNNGNHTRNMSQNSSAPFPHQKEGQLMHRADSMAPEPTQPYPRPPQRVSSYEVHPSPMIFVGNLTIEMIEDNFIQNLFSQCGPINEVHVLGSGRCALIM